MRRERLRVFLESLLVDGQVTGLASIHLRDPDEIHVVDDVWKDDLLDLDRRRHEIEKGRVAEVVFRHARGKGVHLLLQARLLRVHVLDLLADGGHLTGVRRELLLHGAPLGRDRLLLHVQLVQCLFFLGDPLTLARRARFSPGARCLEVVLVVIEVRLPVLVILRGAFEPDVDFVELLLELVDLLLIRFDVLFRRGELLIELLELRAIDRS